MKKKIFNVIVFIVLVSIAVLNSYRYTVLYSLDEIWAYGFGYNISNGLIPYKDFNMVIGPIFPYILSVILSIFGKKLIVYHIFVALMVGAITYLASRKINFFSILIYLAMLIYSSNGYNTSTLLQRLPVRTSNGTVSYSLSLASYAGQNIKINIQFYGNATYMGSSGVISGAKARSTI